VQDERLVLEQELTNIKEQIARLEEALEAQPDYGIGQGDPAVTGREVNRALLERLQERRTSLERALSRSDSGIYGVCTQCGQEINPDRLAVLPDTRLCIRCAQARKKGIPIC
jgi:DnaK suppressor protein